MRDMPCFFNSPFYCPYSSSLLEMPTLPLAVLFPHFIRIKRRLTKLLDRRFQLIEIRLVLPLVLHLHPKTLQNPHSRRVIVNLTRTPERGIYDFWGGHEVVGEAVVESALELKEVPARIEEGPVARVEGFEGFGLVSM